MIVLDASAALAVILREARQTVVTDCLKAAAAIQMSAANALECVMRLAPARDYDNSDHFDEFLLLFGIEIVGVDAKQWRLARAGFIAFGKGRHPAGLNFGDCFAYALAMDRAAPLLFIGNDFSQTDVKRALS